MNKVFLIGRLVKDPSLTFAPGTGKAVTKFMLAINRQFKKDEADFISCVAFNKQAETMAQYLNKGSQISIVGNIRTSNFTDKHNIKQYSTSIVIENFEFISKGKENNDMTESFEGSPFEEK